MSESQIPTATAVEQIPGQSAEQSLDAIYHYAALQMRQGVADSAVEQDLAQRGMDPEVARTIVSQLRVATFDHRKSEGKKNMIYGACWCIGGTAVTALTYLAAADGGGHYVVAWGAVIFGAIQFFRGVGEYMSR